MVLRCRFTRSLSTGPTPLVVVLGCMCNSANLHLRHRNTIGHGTKTLVAVEFLWYCGEFPPVAGPLIYRFSGISVNFRTMASVIMLELALI